MSLEAVGAIFSLLKCCREREVKELKKGASCKLLWSREPKHLWDNCLELEACIRSNTADEIYKLYGEVPEIVMTVETSGIT